MGPPREGRQSTPRRSGAETWCLAGFGVAHGRRGREVGGAALVRGCGGLGVVRRSGVEIDRAPRRAPYLPSSAARRAGEDPGLRYHVPRTRQPCPFASSACDLVIEEALQSVPFSSTRAVARARHGGHTHRVAGRSPAPSRRRGGAADRHRGPRCRPSLRTGCAASDGGLKMSGDRIRHSRTIKAACGRLDAHHRGRQARQGACTPQPLGSP